MTSSTRSTRSTRSPVPIIVGAVVIVALAFVVAILATGDNDDDAPVEAASGDGTVEIAEEPPSVDGQLPTLEDPTTDPAVGQAAPEAIGVGFDGSEVTIGEPGQAQLVVFLAHWCPHCQREVPQLAELLATDRLPEGVEVRAVATASSPERPNYPPSAWLEREELDVPVLVDDARATAATAYGLSGFPFAVAIDDEGRVVARTSGEVGLEGLAALAQLAADGGTS